MSVLKTPPVYYSRSVADWLTMASRGEVLLPSFQRSFVWKPQGTADYLKALLERRPTGILLILESADRPQFKSRSLHGSGCRDGGGQRSGSAPVELVLDGQQRLTSLWGALVGNPERRYFIKVRDLERSQLDVKEVIWRSPKWSNPAKMYGGDFVPTDILWGDRGSSSADGGSPGLSAARKWCEEAVGDGWDSLFEDVTRLRERLVLAPKLQYCLLRKDTDADTAIDIFINVNKSAIKLKEVDIAIAFAEADHHADVRGLVEDYIGRSTEVGHYFSETPGKAIPEVAAWIFKVGCLRIKSKDHPEGCAPKESHYTSAVKSLFSYDASSQSRRDADVAARMNRMGDDLDAALRFAASHGGATKRTLPGWPPVHVIAALQEDVRKLGPGLQDQADRLLSAYLWRAWVTRRYAKQANDRLLDDFRGLRAYLAALARKDRIGSDGLRVRLASLVPVFDNKEHPLPTSDEIRSAGWIGSSSRLGRAIAAVGTRQEPLDWATGDRLDADCVRGLERHGKLLRYHIFPIRLFGDHVGDDVKLGLNGMLVARDSMPRPRPESASDSSSEYLDPHEQLALIRSGGQVDELAVRKRVESHEISYTTLLKEGAAPAFRYRQYLQDRAERVALKIQELTRF